MLTAAQAQFLLGSLFSWTVGFVGMRLATTGNLRVAAAAKRSYGEAMQLGYRTGTITGMLTDGLGLLGGTCIFLAFGEQAYEALLGFGFGGTLLALFMRVGGGIYTKAANVGADLVGKVEAGIPEDDPRNAATIADNVGDNVGDCAGMAADIFESYEVTIVAAMILGLASFGHKGVIFPLLVRGVGVLGSIISTYTVKAGPNDTSDTALKSVHRGFWIGSLISIAGFFLIGITYLYFPPEYFAKGYEMAKNGFPGGIPANLAPWFNFGIANLDMRPALTCLIGVLLAIALNKVTSYYTHTSHNPVKSLARACQTGDATNIIQGFAVGYESTVAALLVIATAIILSVSGVLGHPGRVRGLRRGHDRHRHADADRQHDLDGRVRAGGRQRQRHRRDGLQPRCHGPGAEARPAGIHAPRGVQAGTANPGRPRRGGQHHQGRNQGHRHRLGRDRRRLAVRQLHRRDRRRQRGQARSDDRRAVQVLLRLPHRGRPDGLDRPADRRRRAVPVQLDANSGGWPRSLLHRQGVPDAVQGPGDHGGHEEAQLRARGQHLHQHGPEGTDRSGAAGHRRAVRRGFPPGAVCLGRLFGGHDPRRAASWPCSWPMRAGRGTMPRS